MLVAFLLRWKFTLFQLSCSGYKSSAHSCFPILSCIRVRIWRGNKDLGRVIKRYNLCKILFPSYFLSLFKGYTFQLQVEKRERGCSRSYSWESSWCGFLILLPNPKYPPQYLLVCYHLLKNICVIHRKRRNQIILVVRCTCSAF